MNTRMKELAARREALIAETELQRALAGEACAGLRQGLRLVDRGLSFVRGLRRKPLIVGLASVAVTLLIARPRQAVKWLGYCLSAYSIFRRANALLSARQSD